MLFYLSSGFVLGLTAGVSPGPLLTLVISHTLTYGVRDGIKVALAPLITDPPIILLALFVGAQFASSPRPLGVLSLAGAAYICYLAWEQLTLGPLDNTSARSEAKSIRKGVFTNLLNPHPYMFWITVGVPFILKTWASGPWGAVLWFTVFYSLLVGSKIALSLLVSRSKRWIHGKGYLRLNRGLGIILLFFAIKLAIDGVMLIKVSARGA